MKKMTFLLCTLSLTVVTSLHLGAQPLVSPNCNNQSDPGTGFTCSAHDFSGFDATGTGDTATTGACTFCHPPHRALQSRLLWNHAVSQNAYTWSDSTSTMGGTPMPTISTSWTGPSKYCLSCHDGSVAIGAFAWFNEQSWRGGSRITTNPLQHNAPGDEFQIATATGDLKGNHPVALPYPNFGGNPSTYNGSTTGAAVIKGDFATDPQAYGIRLFNDGASGVTAGAVASKTGIECSSCHGVHNEKSSYPFGVQDNPLLRGLKSGNKTGPGANYLCMKCHAR